jgi:hypothetical protein
MTGKRDSDLRIARAPHDSRAADGPGQLAGYALRSHRENRNGEESSE